MNLISAICEHLITKGKYNELEVKYEIAIQDRRKVEKEFEIKKDEFQIKEKIWTSDLINDQCRIIDLTKENTELRLEIKELKSKNRKKREKKNESEGTSTELSSKTQNDN